MRYKVGLPVKTQGNFTKSDASCQIGDESEKNTVRGYGELTETGIHEEARELEEMQSLSWALSGSMVQHRPEVREDRSS